MKQFLAGAVFGLCGAAVLFPAAYAVSGETGKNLDLFVDALERVRANYVYPIDTGELVDKALHGMLSALDPHSSYLDAKEYAAAQAASADYAGIGLELTMENGVPKIITPIEDGPAARAGIAPGDYIVAIDGTSTLQMPLDDVIRMMQGPLSSNVTLTIRRLAAGPRTLTFAMSRARIAAARVTGARRGQIGYVRISSFNYNTDGELKNVMADLKKQIGPGLKGYILDLRNDPGGLLDQAIAVSDEFLDEGDIVTVQGRDSADIQRYSARPGDIADGKPITVLLNRGSAAGSEIVAGALQDHHRATVLGMRSFGDGTIQTIIPLGNDRALRLTTAKIVLPSGKAIQTAGITPDVVVAQDPEGIRTPDDDLIHPNEESLRGHFPGAPRTDAAAPILYPDKPNPDFQLATALARMTR